VIGSEQQTGQPFLYDAFISYRHVERDRKWAEWLINALERYRVPRALQERGLPPRLQRIFRDEDEVPASGDLNNQIREALEASRFLIVVCSAFTPRSKWVEREIEIFDELGRSDQVLALLTEGEPGDSFPNAMLVRRRQVIQPDGTTQIVKEDKEPLAADVRPRKGQSVNKLRRIALLRLVAVILGVRFDDLLQREQQRERKRRLTWVGLAATVVLLIAGGGAGYWDMMRPKTAYYRQLVWRWGLPEGAGKIDAETHDHLARSYSVITQRGRVVEVRHDGWIRAEGDGQHRWVVDYREDGSAERIEIFGPTGRLVRENVLRREPSGNKMIVTFEHDNVPVTQAATQNLITDPSHFSQDQGLVQAKSEITRHELIFDDKGFAVEIHYQDYWGTPRHDAADSFGQHFSYSPEGLVLRSAEIGPNGAEITPKNGVHAVTFAYDKDLKIVRHTLLGDDGKPFSGPDGYAYYVRDDFDRWGNETKQTYYGVDGRPAVTRDGYARLSAAFDERGDNIEIAFYDAEGRPALDKNGYASIRRKFDARSYAIEETVFDLNGTPTLNALGYATIRQAFDEWGNRVETVFLGVDGTPILNKEGIAKITYKFDPSGDEVERAFFGVDGHPVPSGFGYAGFRQAWDDRGNRIELAYFDVNGTPILSKEGIAKVTYKFDTRGNEIERAFFGVDGLPALSSFGYAGFRQAWDDRGNKIEIKYFGIDGRPTLSTEGIAKTAYTFNERGNEIERAFFGVDGKPTPITNGYYARMTRIYDARGNDIEEAYFGIDSKPTLNTTISAAKITSLFDARGHIIETALFGIDSQPTRNREGFAKATYTYDPRGDLIAVAYFGIDGKPTLGTTNGVATARQTYDSHGNRIEVAYFGIDGKPILPKDGAAKITYKFDARGNEIEQASFGVDGKPIASKDGYARIIYEYDNVGHEIHAAYLDTQDREISIELVALTIFPGSTAERIGLRAGDRIVSYDGKTPVSTQEFVNLATDATGNTSRVLVVRRGAETVNFEVAPGRLGFQLGTARADRASAAQAASP
jgi:hypothetical protein